VHPDETQCAHSLARRLSRRRCVGLLASSGVVALLAACGNTGAATATTASDTMASATPPAPTSGTAVAPSTAAATTTGTANVAAASTASAASTGSTAASAAAVIKIQTTGAKLPTGPTKFHWVDSGDQKAVFFRAFFPAYHAAHPNISATYDPLPWNEIAKIIPLGVQNGDAPDVYQLPPAVPHAQAIADGWVASLDDIIPNFAAWKAAFPPGSFVTGITDFNGKTYTIPLTTNQRYGTLLLYNLDLMQKAGYDPASKPLTWDEFRAAAKKITSQGGGKTFGLLIEGNQTARFTAWVGGLAEMAFGQGNTMNWQTGQYNYSSDGWLAALDLLLAMKADGSIYPGSLQLNAAQARAQMPVGIAGMLLQGPWNVPQWQLQNPTFKFGVSGQPVPNQGQPFPMGYGPGGSNQLWVYAKSPNKAIAGDILYQLGTLPMQISWADLDGAADPPIFPAALKSSTLDPLSKQTADLFKNMVLTPSPEARNPDVSKVLLEQRHITPDDGQTIQGIYTGQLANPKQAMQDLQNRMEAELNRSIKAAQAKGAKVTRDDWKFGNWDPRKDYTDADYKALKG
jgi:multiple sugar transport system substrate-binding protein